MSRIFLLSCIIIYSQLSCSTQHEIAGIYQHNYNQDYGYTIGTLVLNKDSTFLFHIYGNQFDYDYHLGSCGKWFMKKDSIHLVLFDTIPYHVEYLHDTSDHLTLELFDNYDCQYLNEAMVFSPEMRPMFDIIYGSYLGNISPEYKSIYLVAPRNHFQLDTIAIKRDSMHIKVHGLYIQTSDGDQNQVIVQKGQTLVGFCNPHLKCTGEFRKTVYYKKSYLDPYHFVSRD